MKISLKWINDFVNIENIDPRELAELLTLKTAETEGVYIVKEHYSDIVIAKIIKTEKIHKKYYKCTVLADKEYTVVSGAPNTREGITTFFVKPGGKIDDFTITEKKINNVLSQGMLLSGKELGINNDHSGIIELDNSLKENTDIDEIIDFYDTIIEIDNKSLTHRPDLWGIYGFAREIAAITGKKLKQYEVFDTNKINSNNTINIEIKNKELCYRYVGIKINNIKIEESPLNIQTRLTRTEHTPRNLIVDLTNYIMAEIGQPMHSFDGDKIKSIVVDTLKEDTEYITLDNEKRKLKSGTLMIMNNKEPVAIAGIMGGGNSEINDNSTSLFLESANFNAGNIRKTSSDITLRTDSSQRFEKSLDPENALLASLRYIKLLKDIQRNIKFATKLIDINHNPFKKNIVKTQYSFIKKIMGTNIENNQIKSILESLEFGIKEENDNIEITCPTFRSTKDISLQEDIVEEVARIYGYDNIAPQLPKLEINIPDFNKERDVEHKIKDILSYNYNMNEIDSYIWYDNKFLKKIKFPKNNAIEIKNPISSNNTHLRMSMLPTLLQYSYENLKFADEFSLYDISSVFIDKNEIHKLAIIIVNKKIKNGDNNVFIKMKKIISNILYQINNYLPEYKNTNEEYTLMNPVYTADIFINNKKYGYMGTIHPSFNTLLDKKVNIAFCEIDMDMFLLNKKDIIYKEFSQFPQTELDFSILKPNSISFKEFENIIKSFNNSLINNVELIAIYEGKNIDENFKSITYRFTIGHKDKTLNSDEINEFNKQFIEYIKEKGYQLR